MRRSRHGLGVLAAGGAALCIGCSEPQQQPDGWYDYSKTLDDRKREYIQNQVSVGIDEADATRQFGLDYSIEQTWGRTRLPTLDGEYLEGSAAAGATEDPNRLAPKRVRKRR